MDLGVQWRIQGFQTRAQSGIGPSFLFGKVFHENDKKHLLSPQLITPWDSPLCRMCSMLHFAGMCDGVEPMHARASLAHPVYAKHRQIAITAAARPPPATAQHDAWRQRPTGR